MSSRVVLLRAVNVGGATLPMVRLKALAAELGGTEISTHIASGNLLVDVSETRDDRWTVIGTELHLRYADGAGRPQMKINPIMRALGTSGTARNLNTVRQLIALTS